MIQEIYQLTAENHSKATDIDAYYQEEKKVQRRQLESLQDDM